jgi:predicted Rossmann fold nucleotide-binding protein DprA/Smf involved in DNA uptake
MVEAALRRSGADLPNVVRVLSNEGLWLEATTLEQPGLLAWAERAYDQGVFLSAVEDSYPAAWLRLGASAPPVLWKSGQVPQGLFLGVVGSRRVSPRVQAFAREVAAEAVRLGYAVVSGGAAGCDSAAAAGAAGCALEVLPYGVQHHRSDHAALSLCPPEEPFSSAAAMERNALIYAAAEQAVVAHTRFREGGTWTGAAEALRRKRCPLIVREDPGLQGHRALIALGAKPLTHPSHLTAVLSATGQQASLLYA